MTIYQRAIEEFELADEDGQHQLIYAYFGLAIYTAQCIEQSFTNMIWLHRIFKEKVITPVEMNKIVEEVESAKMTMGNLLNEVKATYAIDEKIGDRLKEVLKERNYLAHQYFKMEIQKFHTEIGRKEMLVYLAKFTDNAREVDNTIGLYYEKYHKKLGITEDKLNELVEEQKRIEVERVHKLDTTS